MKHTLLTVTFNEETKEHSFERNFVTAKVKLQDEIRTAPFNEGYKIRLNQMIEDIVEETSTECAEAYRHLWGHKYKQDVYDFIKNYPLFKEKE